MNCECANLEWRPEYYALEHHPDCKGKATVTQTVQGFPYESAPGTMPVNEKVYCLTVESHLARDVKIYLDGVEQKRCFAAYVTADSFTMPCHGKLIVGFPSDGKDLYAQMCTPEMVLKHSLFDCDGLMCQFVEGKVFVEVDDDEALALFFRLNS